MTSDWIQTFFIIFMFTSFMAIVSLLGSVKSIQDNWSLYRCNPIIMPLSGYFAPEGNTTTTSENFSYCIQNIMTGFAPAIIEPLSYLQTMTIDLMAGLSTGIDDSQAQSSEMSFNISSIFSSIFETLLNVVIKFNLIITKLLDAQGKLSGMITTLLYIMTTVQYTFESMWDGIPGDMLRSMKALS